MAEVINITEYIKKKEEAELEKLSTRLAQMIEELGITSEFEAYMSSDEHVYGMPFLFTMYPQYPETNQVNTLSDVTDVLTSITLKLDEIGHTGWANDISKVVGEMFVSGTSRGTFDI